MECDLVTPCAICDEWVYISGPKVAVCDKCKAAVMKIRAEIDQTPLQQVRYDEDYHTYSGLLSED